jgi:hypothetical protein
VRLVSNIDAVIGQVERLKANVPKAAQAVLTPERWADPARRMAQSILTTLAKPEEQRFVAAFVKTVTAALVDGGLSIAMHDPGTSVQNLTLTEAQTARALNRANELGLGLFDKPLFTFEELILKWVQTPEEEGGKKRDHRDWGKTDEEVATLISRIMLTPGVERGSGLDEARKKLMPHIVAWLQQNENQPLSPVTIDLWLRAVLAGWREMVKLYFPSMLKHELRGMK